jgi:hypothetical protein
MGGTVAIRWLCKKDTHPDDLLMRTMTRDMSAGSDFFTSLSPSSGAAREEAR